MEQAASRAQLRRRLLAMKSEAFMAAYSASSSGFIDQKRIKAYQYHRKQAVKLLQRIHKYESGTRTRVLA